MYWLELHRSDGSFAHVSVCAVEPEGTYWTTQQIGRIGSVVLTELHASWKRIVEH